MRALTPGEERELDEITLIIGPGHYSTRMCAMQVASLLECKPPTSDRPDTVSEVIRYYTICLNDRLDDTTRQLLKPIIPRLLGTRDGMDRQRVSVLGAYLARVVTAAYADAAGQADTARDLSALPATMARWSQADMASVRAAVDTARGLWGNRGPIYGDVRGGLHGTSGAVARAALDAMLAAENLDQTHAYPWAHAVRAWCEEASGVFATRALESGVSDTRALAAIGVTDLLEQLVSV